MLYFIVYAVIETLLDKSSQICSRKQEFMVVGQIHKFYKSRDGRETFTALHVVSSVSACYGRPMK